MESIELKVPGARLILPHVERDWRSLSFRFDLTSVFLPVVQHVQNLLPKMAMSPTRSPGPRLITCVQGGVFACIADARPGSHAEQQVVVLSDGGGATAPGAALLVPAGCVLGVIAGGDVSKVVIGQQSAAPLEVAPDGFLRWPRPVELPVPRPVLAGQLGQAMAPLAAPEEPDVPSPTRAGAWMDELKRRQQAQQ